MNRRGFLQLLGAGAAGFALDPEMLLWKPGAKTIFIPPVRPVSTGYVKTGLKPGDIFTISGCYNVNPLGHKELQRFMVQADVTAQAPSVLCEYKSGHTSSWLGTLSE